MKLKKSLTSKEEWIKREIASYPLVERWDVVNSEGDLMATCPTKSIAVAVENLPAFYGLALTILRFIAPEDTDPEKCLLRNYAQDLLDKVNLQYETT